ncbi:MAG TPA: pilin [Casimicrobiaceae bacterium]
MTVATSAILPAGPRSPAGLEPPTLDSIVFPAFVREHQDERRVRPALAVLFRIAVGPHADYYARRFVKYERTGRNAPSWNWPAFVLPTIWAFYRKLWAYGVACALLPLAGALAFAAFAADPGDSSLAWWGGALLSVWLVPSLVSATFANTFYYRCIRELIRQAERNTRSAETAASRLVRRGATDAVLAALFGAGTLLFVASLAGPILQTAYQEQGVRAKVLQAIGAMKPLQRQVEDNWARTHSIPQRPDYGAVRKQEGYTFVQAVDLNAGNGRVRFVLGSAVPELQGRSILLAPAVDGWQKLRWLCIPIDIPVAYVPAACAR